MNQNECEQLFARDLIDTVLSKLAGNHPDYSQITQFDKPSKEFILGSLCPIPDKEDMKDKTKVKASAITVSFLCKDLPKSITVLPKFKVFHGEKTVLEEGVDKKKPRPSLFKRYDATPEKIDLTEENNSVVFVYTALREFVSKDYPSQIAEIPEWKIRVIMNIADYEKDQKYITLSFENLTDDSVAQYKEHTIFDVSLEININTDLHPFVFKYDYEGFTETYQMPIQCNNCSASYDDKTRTIVTTAVKIFPQPRIEPRTNLHGLNGEETQLNFRDLAILDKRKAILTLIANEMQKYQALYQEKRPQPTDRSYAKYVAAEEKFADVFRQFKSGLEVLETDERAARAFTLLQDTFSETNRNKYPGWRLFQLVFLISQLTDIVKGTGQDTAEVLHVDTGGGKSEAYFALVVFAAFYDRIRGKLFGITAITKFPLRMLSIQQLQRVASLMMVAEEVRKRNQLTGDPFSVAYFVGESKEFPNHNKDLIIKVNANPDTVGKIITVCPICNGQVILAVRNDDETVIHTCKSCSRIYNLYFTDEEVYRKLPTFVVATVDKFAGVSSNRKFRSLFGGKVTKCPKGHGYMPVGDICDAVKKTCKETGIAVQGEFDRGPTLIIQDEMHLVREGFGTIDSHFEAYLETLQRKFQGKGFKNIAMTATISGASHQIRQLYNKNVRVFPGISPMGKGVSDFFFDLKSEEVQRLIIGLRPNVRENQFAIRRTFDHILHYIEMVEADKIAFCNRLKLPLSSIDPILTNYKSYLSYHHKKNDVQDIKYYSRHKADETLSVDHSAYAIEPIVLTGDDTLDEIRGRIAEIESQDTLNTKLLKIVYATSIVSHGVDIAKWNIMCFQGMTRGTAEYIQALSRVGRHHVGIVFMWFYPNRIRDVSYYNKFREYHEMLEHHVTEVPVMRFAKLGFFQTFNSLFCATILNYFSEIHQMPLYKVEDVNRIFSNMGERDKLITFLKEAYLVNSHQDGSDFYETEIPAQVEKRLNKLFEALQKNTLTNGEKNFFPNALRASSDPYFQNQFGMRGIQAEVVLEPVSYHTSLVSGYLQITRREFNG